VCAWFENYLLLLLLFELGIVMRENSLFGPIKMKYSFLDPLNLRILYLTLLAYFGV
jgi:hypothetical protein